MNAMDALFKVQFPNLHGVQQKKTSEQDPNYNCIAWAFENNTRHWWPNQNRSYWPIQSAGLTAMEAFERLFSSGGWEETDDRNAESAYHKIALYALNGAPTHAARLLNTGAWTSKLGQSIDISHSLDELNGPIYGTVVKVFRKKIVV